MDSGRGPSVELLRLVRDTYRRMTKSEQKVADAFLSNFDGFAFSTLDMISREIGVSTTTTIRFCRTLGYEGYKEFQYAVRQELKPLAKLPDKLLSLSDENADSTLLERTIQRAVHNIYRTFNELSKEALTRAVELLSNSKRLFIFGMRESYSMCHYAYSRLITVRDEVFLLNAGNQGMVESLLSLNAEDTCLVFVFRRYTDLTVRILPILKNRGAKVILVTSDPFDALAPYADALLPCYLDVGGIKNSYVAPACLVDYFCSATSAGAKNNRFERMNQIEDVLKSTGMI